MKGKLVLVISADCNLRQTARAFLERRGFHATTAHCVAEAERMLTWGVHPCIVLVDRETGSRDEIAALLSQGQLAVDLPTRTSRSGVRRMAKVGAELDALHALLDEHCRPTNLAA